MSGAKKCHVTGKIWERFMMVSEDLNCRIIGFEPEKMGWNTKNRMLTITKLGVVVVKHALIQPARNDLRSLLTQIHQDQKQK
jgi:hypothetical protein